MAGFSTGERNPAAVRQMFDRIAARYELANTVLSGGLDASWRRAAAQAAAVPAGGLALDIACGSGNLARDLVRQQGAPEMVVGLDFSRRMLELTARRGGGVTAVQGDALRLPFADRTFDAATMAFGLRNLAHQSAGLQEMLRVIRPGGRVVVLEFVRPPRGAIGAAYRAYLKAALPVLGGAISGDGSAYRYLSDTVDSYRSPGQLAELASGAGWRRLDVRLLTFGTVALLAATR
jgi:demethylmenaquinone methyltransferase/2-methoxy-6-polyprenyl-1,4-benzoquinol methylase